MRKVMVMLAMAIGIIAGTQTTALASKIAVGISPITDPCCANIQSTIDGALSDYQAFGKVVLTDMGTDFQPDYRMMVDLKPHWQVGQEAFRATATDIGTDFQPDYEMMVDLKPHWQVGQEAFRASVDSIDWKVEFLESTRKISDLKPHWSMYTQIAAIELLGTEIYE